MALFKRKEKDNTDPKKQLMTAFDRMQYFIMEERNDEEMYQLCDMILSGKPVLVNLDKIPVSDCNYILSFVSGVVYATRGEVIKVGERLYLFARREEFEDGSLHQYVEEIKQ